MRYLLLAALLTCSLQAQVTPEWIQTQVSEFKKESGSHKAEYIKGLESLFEGYKKQGRLQDAIATRNHLRAFSQNGLLSESDIVEIPTELGTLQKSYLKKINETGNRIFGAAQSKIDNEVAELVKKGELDKAESLKRDFQKNLDSVSFTPDAKLALGSESLPKEVTISENHTIKISILGQTTSDFGLNEGETYQLRGLSGGDVVILVGKDVVSIPAAKTDLIDRIAAKKKGIEYIYTPKPKNAQLESSRYKTRESSSLSRNLVTHTDFKNAYATKNDDGYKIGKRGGVSIPTPHPSKVRVSVVVEFIDNDEVHLLTRSDLKRWGAYGGFQGVGVSLNQKNQVISIQRMSPDHTLVRQMPYRFENGRRYNVDMIDDGRNISVSIDGNLVISGSDQNSYGRYCIIYSHEGGASYVSDFRMGAM